MERENNKNGTITRIRNKRHFIITVINVLLKNTC
jgi:hypothetical protein